MNEIKRFEVNDTWAHSGIVKAGGFCFLSYCVGNIGGTIEQQINGAFDVMEERFADPNNLLFQVDAIALSRKFIL